MIDRSQAGEPPEEFNPHMQALIPPRGRQRGPGWEQGTAGTPGPAPTRPTGITTQEVEEPQ
jgi:hypothetical protein